VRLGAGLNAWRYRNVAVDVANVADVYVLGDREGPIVAACVAPTGAPASVREPCAATLTTLRLHAGPVLPLGGGAAARHELAQVVADLDSTRERERHAFAVAASGRQQAAAADRLSAAYAAAAEAARRIGTVGAPGDLPRLVDRLGETAQSYTALAAAARATRRTTYARARASVVAHEHALQQDLVTLASAGPDACQPDSRVRDGGPRSLPALRSRPPEHPHPAIDGRREAAAGAVRAHPDPVEARRQREPPRQVRLHRRGDDL